MGEREPVTVHARRTLGASNAVPQQLKRIRAKDVRQLLG